MPSPAPNQLVTGDTSMFIVSGNLSVPFTSRTFSTSAGSQHSDGSQTTPSHVSDRLGLILNPYGHGSILQLPKGSQHSSFEQTALAQISGRFGLRAKPFSQTEALQCPTCVQH